MKSLEIICLFFVSSIFFLSCKSNNKTSKVFDSDNCEQQFHKVKFEALLDSLSFYHNKYVEVSGFFRSGFEESALFNSQNRNGQAFWVDFDPKLSNKEIGDTILLLSSLDEYNKLINKKIIIKGLIDTSGHGHLSQYIAEIVDVCYLETAE